METWENPKVTVVVKALFGPTVYKVQFTSKIPLTAQIQKPSRMSNVMWDISFLKGNRNERTYAELVYSKFSKQIKGQVFVQVVGFIYC